MGIIITLFSLLFCFSNSIWDKPSQMFPNLSLSVGKAGRRAGGAGGSPGGASGARGTGCARAQRAQVLRRPGRGQGCGGQAAGQGGGGSRPGRPEGWNSWWVGLPPFVFSQKYIFRETLTLDLWVE